MKETLKDPYYCPHCGKWIERETSHSHLLNECDQRLSKANAPQKPANKLMKEEWEARSKGGQTWFSC